LCPGGGGIPYNGLYGDAPPERAPVMGKRSLFQAGGM